MFNNEGSTVVPVKLRQLDKGYHCYTTTPSYHTQNTFIQQTCTHLCMLCSIFELNFVLQNRWEW